MTFPIACTIAGSDVSGGAGIQSDLHTFQNLKVHACSVITAITAQSLHAIHEIYYLPASIIKAELESLPENIKAIKIGMLGESQIINVVIDFLRDYKGFVVLDPLLIASAGKPLYKEVLSYYLKKLKQLFPYINLLTPNKAEVETLLKRRISSSDEIIEAAKDILALGVQSVLIKGGHFANEFSQDYWTNGEEGFWLANKRYENRQVHGTGCVMSSSIAASVALGYSLKDALVIAKMYVNRGIRFAEPTETLTLFQHQTGWPAEEIDLPILNNQPVTTQSPFFNQKDLFQMGLYPIVNSLAWLQLLLPLKINCIQLRIKNKTGSELTKEIREAVILAKKYHIKLFINDYWEEAITFGAYGVHLGQEDLNTANVAAIHAAGLRLGISTHSYEELARAHFYQPSYIAYGPIFMTTSKKMSFAPQGLQSLACLRKTLNYPLIAIGGIHEKNILSILETKVDGVALISAITTADHPVSAASQLIKMVNAHGT